jgi:hypothetical protein
LTFVFNLFFYIVFDQVFTYRPNFKNLNDKNNKKHIREILLRWHINNLYARN